MEKRNTDKNSVQDDCNDEDDNKDHLQIIQMSADENDCMIDLAEILCCWLLLITHTGHQQVSNFMCITWLNDPSLTMIIMTAAPDRILGNLSSGGKYGSRMPVIGFFSKNGHLAEYSGLGLSCERS